MTEELSVLKGGEPGAACSAHQVSIYIILQLLQVVPICSRGWNQCLRVVLLKLECACESPGDFVKMQILLRKVQDGSGVLTSS